MTTIDNIVITFTLSVITICFLALFGLWYKYLDRQHDRDQLKNENKKSLAATRDKTKHRK